MNAFYLFLTALVLLSAGISVFGRSFRLRVISVWVASLVLSFIFLNLKNELLALTLCFVSTASTWTVITHSLVFGEIQRTLEDGKDWRSWILPSTGALMFLGIILLGLPAWELPTPTSVAPTSERVLAADFGSQILSRFFVFAVTVAAVALAAVVGVGMVARSEWLNEKEKP